MPWGLTLQAVLHDAGTYDPSAKTGGLNGSLRYELNRVENKQLGAVIKQVEAAKAKIDASPLSTAPISFSDTLALAGLVGFAQVVWRVCALREGTLPPAPKALLCSSPSGRQCRQSQGSGSYGQP